MNKIEFNPNNKRNMCCFDCLFNFLTSLKKTHLYVVLFISAVTFFLGPIMIGVHYETSVDLPKWFLIVNFVFTIFWAGLIGLIFLLVFLLIAFIFMQFCCESCSDKYCNTEESSFQERYPHIPTTDTNPHIIDLEASR